jgi:hypothetical protein
MGGDLRRLSTKAWRVLGLSLSMRVVSLGIRGTHRLEPKLVGKIGILGLQYGYVLAGIRLCIIMMRHSGWWEVNCMTWSRNGPPS